MTCIFIANLGRELILAVDKRVSYISEDGKKHPVGDNEEKITRTAAGIVTGCGAVALLQPVKDYLKQKSFKNTDEVLELIKTTRANHSRENANSSRLKSELAETCWILTYPTYCDGKPITRAIYFHPSSSLDNFVVLPEGRVLCIPSGLTPEQAQHLQKELQEQTDNCLSQLPYEIAKQEIIKLMLNLMSDVAGQSNTVSKTCDIALIDSDEVFISLEQSKDNTNPEFSPLPYPA
ncbi:TPA: hypothetical protein ACRZS3_005966 [Pseudomonas aeruginosa]|uniref:hypothetical protein n=1 Tax=Pseudomonas aeruginosa TaxID=287 RepID=UPI001043CBDA|nr:hypothetical protein [Pseudomonas aeruginosa]ELP1285411.1 hypothetical protein [Pseudomonas aeruginosa]MBH3931701.1 hypothetical protein [Pseudomonas aeruginosa]MBH4379062.1 hypothetical protein [Pseudomonas aeruginosa]MBX5914052.1 hypothetical protein [Pseudomonas aeruginosa]MCC0132722.1 hypothetical protein [Pseudomonas aeruginosa]